MPDRADLRLWLARLQGAYYLLTGIWPIVHIGSFMAVTGPKEDLWLVQTVGALVCSIAVALLVAGWTGDTGRVVWTLGAGSALAFLLVDVVFVADDRIGPIYLADAVLEALLLIGWVVSLPRPSHTSRAGAA